MARKRGQAWGFDLVIGLTIFLIGLVSLYLYTTNLSGKGEETLQELQQQAEVIAESLVSEGSPADWSATNVVRIGLLSNNRINETKVAAFRSMNYAQTKSLFRIRDEYFMYFDAQESNGIGLDYSGANNLVRTTRVVVYNSNITTLHVFAWN